MRCVDAVNRVVGRITMYSVFALMGVLLLSSTARTFFGVSFIWSVEMAQFLMAAYYLVGGGYSLQLDSHVRMDIIYSRWTPKRRALTDCLTAFFLLFYLVFLLVGGISSTEYALEYDQVNYSSWGPQLAPIKIVMCIGILLMLLQAVSSLFKDLATARGETLA